MPHPEDKPGDYLENEKKNDPLEVQREYMELAKEALQDLREQKEARKRRAPTPIGGIPAYAYADGPCLHGPEPVIHLRIEVIRNGILVHHGSGMEHFVPRAPGIEIEYAQDPVGAEAIVFRILREFLVSALGTPVPEAGKGLPGASPGMVRLPGPPPVSGPLEGPLEP